MFSCLYKDMNPDPTSSPKDTGEEKARPGLLCLLLREKGGDGPHSGRLLFVVYLLLQEIDCCVACAVIGAVGLRRRL